MLIRAFLLCENTAFRTRFLRLLQRMHVHVAKHGNGADFWEELARAPVDIVVASAPALHDDSTHLIKSIRQLPDGPDVFVITQRDDEMERARLVSAGAMAVFHGKLPDEALASALAALIHRKREESTKKPLLGRNETTADLGDFVSSSPSMTKLVGTARRVADADTSLLIVGETGVGKERLAKAIHGHSPRARGPFVALNCAAIPDGLFESELFGHEKGSFTGAYRARRGYFELAHRGTLFLDEVGELSLAAQVKLLRVIQERRIQPLGGEQEISVDVRIIAATNRDLTAEVAAQRFRRDLFYRLSVITLMLPPLRERPGDIPLLVEHYRRYFAERLRRPVTAISPQAMDMLLAYSWPGNVRELINVIEHAVLLCSDGNTIGPLDLPDVQLGTVPMGAGDSSLVVGTSDWALQPWSKVRAAVLRTAERHYLEMLLRETSGRIGVAASRAGITPRSVSRKLRRNKLSKESFRN